MEGRGEGGWGGGEVVTPVDFDFVDDSSQCFQLREAFKIKKNYETYGKLHM